MTIKLKTVLTPPCIVKWYHAVFTIISHHTYLVATSSEITDHLAPSGGHGQSSIIHITMLEMVRNNPRLDIVKGTANFDDKSTVC